MERSLGKVLPTYQLSKAQPFSFQRRYHHFNALRKSHTVYVTSRDSQC